MLELHGVTAGYGDTTVLWDVSLRVGRGEAVALLGRNGMGKTTTLRTIMGLIALVFFLPDGLYPLLFRKETRS
ncbi:MAG TPA: ATP-binding cassette domain-containing protein [Methylomirabilota bacterium]|jgi:ABC-type branched-subunit amino acid transport system ATPase component